MTIYPEPKIASTHRCSTSLHTGKVLSSSSSSSSSYQRLKHPLARLQLDWRFHVDLAVHTHQVSGVFRRQRHLFTLLVKHHWFFHVATVRLVQGYVCAIEESESKTNKHEYERERRCTHGGERGLVFRKQQNTAGARVQKKEKKAQTRRRCPPTLTFSNNSMSFRMEDFLTHMTSNKPSSSLATGVKMKPRPLHLVFWANTIA